MDEWVIYYNPKCGTCRNTLELLKSKKINPRIVEYLKTPPTVKELGGIADKLGKDFPLMIRTKEPIYDELKLAGKSKAELLKAIAENPILLQRPIVVHGQRAVVARPPENVEILTRSGS